jgi:hypothetical protein
MLNAAKIVKGHCNGIRIFVGGLRVEGVEGGGNAMTVQSHFSSCSA